MHYIVNAVWLADQLGVARRERVPSNLLLQRIPQWKIADFKRQGFLEEALSEAAAKVEKPAAVSVSEPETPKTNANDNASQMRRRKGGKS
jgi:hypothetical protein